MCLAVPAKIIKTTQKTALIKNNYGKIIKVNTSLIKKPKNGDWLLVQANLAIKKISIKEAKEILCLFN